MNCRRVVNLISAYVDGELTGEEMLAIRRHLSECDECAEECESIRLTKQALVNLRTAVPRRELAVSILKQLDEVEIPRHQRLADSFLRFLHDKLSPVAAALAVSGAALVIMSAGNVDNITPQTGREVVSAVTVPFDTRAQDVTFVRELRTNSVAFMPSEPLPLANERPDFGGATLHPAVFSPQ